MQTTQNECGICVISMLASFYGFRKPISYYRERFNIGRDGMSLKNLCYILSDISLEPVIEKITHIDNEIIKKKTPYIICANNHYIVLEKIKNNRCYIYDPARGKIIESLEDINKKFSGYIVSVNKTENFKKSKDDLKDFKYIVQLIKIIRRRLIKAVLISIICNIVLVIVPTIIQEIIDSLIYLDKTVEYGFMFGKILLILTVYFILTRLRNNSLVNLQGDIIDNLSMRTISHLLRVPYSFFDNRGSGDIIFRLNLLQGIEKTLVNTIITLIIGITTIVVVGIYMIIYNIYIIPIMLLISAILIIFVMIENKKLTYKNRKLLTYNQALESLQTEIIMDMFQIKCMNLTDQFNNMYKAKLSEYKDEFIKNQKALSDYSLIIDTVNLFLPIIVITLIVFGNMSNITTIGQLFTIYILIGYFIKYITTSANACTHIHQMKASLFYINDMLDEREVENNGYVISDSFNDLRLIDLGFRYNDRQKLLLNNINLYVNSGEKISIVGSSAAGKTTLVKLMGRLYSPSEGKILLNNYKANDFEDESYSKMIGIVPQIPLVFNKTIYENLTLGNGVISVIDVVEVLKMVNLWEEVKKMPMKLNTTISGQGGNLSGGQIQRLTIARALIKKPKLLILDEATSSLDSKNERIIFKNLKMSGITLIVISHRISTIEDSNRIYVLEDGCISAFGSHDELLKNNEYYSQLNRNCE